MGRKRLAFAAVLIGIIGAAIPGRAAVTCNQTPAAGRRYIDVAMLEQGFSPFTQQAFAGDVVRWTVGGGSQHLIAPYAPKTVSGFQASPVLSPGDVFCILFGGGSVWYRDAHSQSSVVDETSNVCQGRCGSISDRTADPAAPVITPPSGPSETKPTLIQGTSEALTLVKLAEIPSGETAYDKGTPIGQALADENGAWKVNLDLDGGSHNLVARAIDAAGRESVDSTATGSTVTFDVVKDSEPPALTVTQPTPPILLSGSSISGTATDNARVARVVALISDVRNGQAIGGHNGQRATVIEQFVCPPPEPVCPPGNVPWSFVLQPASQIIIPVQGQPQPVIVALESGVWTVRITAYDAWNNASPAAEFTVVVVRPPRLG